MNRRPWFLVALVVITTWTCFTPTDSQGIITQPITMLISSITWTRDQVVSIVSEFQNKYKSNELIFSYINNLQQIFSDLGFASDALMSILNLFNPLNYINNPLNIFSLVTDPFTAIVSFLHDFIEQLVTEPSDTLEILNEYDFIIVGAGSAGSVIANRLTEIADWNVLLIEAGGPENFLMDIPLFLSYTQLTPANWDYRTLPSEKYCLGFKNHQCKWPRGKVMGGSSVLNYMIYTRGAPQDFDNWEALGNDGWGWDDVLPYFKKIENYKIREFVEPEYHSNTGYLSVDYAPFRTQISKSWVRAAEEYGFQYGDLNGPDNVGVSHLQLTMLNGTRHSSSRAYLHTINERKNLRVTKNSFVTKLLMDDTKNNVVGVELEKNGKIYKVYAKKEVVISAGTVNSAQLLMVSGIGPKVELESFGIAVLKDLPVGHNMKEHVATGGIQFVVDRQNISLSTKYIATHPNVVIEYMKTHTGPLSVPGGCEALIFTNLQDKFNPLAWPDFEILLAAAGLNSDPSLRYNLNFDDRIFEETYGPLGDLDTFTIFPILVRPKSKGHIKLQSSDPHVKPIIIPNYFAEEDDLRKLVDGTKLAIEISKEEALRRIGTKLYDVPVKECLQYGPFGSDEYFKCQTRMFPFTLYHPIGTCRMGENEHNSVVNTRLLVHGFNNLRVIDASVMPEIPSAHVNAATYMVAEKGADMIKEDWNTIKKHHS